MKDCDLKASYLSGPNGSLFCMTYSPVGRQQRYADVIIHVPPFAEEMNKSRPMVAAQAKQMAAMGYPVILFDLYGTGDSSGQFEEATWEGWIADLQFVCTWATETLGAQRLMLWGLRAGCLLAGAFMQMQVQEISRLIFWQPIISGERILTQLRRLNDLSGDSKAEGKTEVEIAGYELNAKLILQVSQASLENLPLTAQIHLDWLEVNVMEGEKLAAASEQLLVTLREQPTTQIRSAVVHGEPFWLTAEVSMVPALIDQTLQMLSYRATKNHQPLAES